MSLSRNIAIILSKEKASPASLVTLLTKYKMLSLLPSIRKALVQISTHGSKNDALIIESPFPLSDTSIIKIKHITNSPDIEHQVIINKEVLAGFKARYQGILYDGSAERIIKQLVGKQ